MGKMLIYCISFNNKCTNNILTDDNDCVIQYTPQLQLIMHFTDLKKVTRL